MERKLAAILAADVVGYSALMERDEAGTFDRLKARRSELFGPEIERHHGRIFKLMGDGLLAEFGSVVDAVECAVALQRGMAERNAAVPEEQRIEARIGINLGEVIVEGDDRYGEGVNVAARLQELADPGGICVSGKVAKEVEKKLAFGFEPMGEQRVKNIAEPVPVYRVKLDGPPERRTVLRGKAGGSLRWAAAACAAIAVVGGGWLVFRESSLSPISTASATIPSIAVLPFEDLSADKSLAYLGDGIADDIITMLSRSPDLAVIARTSSFTYKGKAVDVRQIGKELGVGYVLEGSVRREGDKARIVAQLIDATSGEHAWAERFDKSGADPWALQDEVTAKIVSAMTGEKGVIRQADYREAWGKDSTNLAEYDYYLRGHDQFFTFTPQGVERGGEIWREGLAKFPGSPLLKVKLGWYHMFRAQGFISDDPPRDIREAGELTRAVLANEHVSPQVARLAHWLMAWVLVNEQDFDGAVAEADRAAALAPYDTFVLSDLMNVLTQAGEPEKALEWGDVVAVRDPALAWFYNFSRGWAFMVLGRLDEAAAALGQTDYLDAPLLLAAVYVRENRIPDAEAQVAKMLKANATMTVATWRQAYSFRDTTVVERVAADLVKAGLPEE